ncbi:MAG: hypothetical protein ACW98K_17430 [Candidatus Kariarchaeaceae archaeon]|jgi:hypothetical protein
MEFPLKYVPTQISYQESAQILNKTDREEFDAHFKSQLNAALLSRRVFILFALTLALLLIFVVISGIDFVELGILIGLILSVGITYRIMLSKEKIAKNAWEVYLGDKVKIDKRMQLRQVLDLTILEYIDNYNRTS